MSPLDGDLLRLLSHMPLLDRMEMAALSGWSGGGVYRAVGRLEDAGLIASVPHGTELIPSDPQVPPHRRRAAPAGPRGERGPRIRCGASSGGPAARPARLGPLAARSPGTTRRRGRRLPHRRRHIEHGPSRPVPVVSSHADGRRRDPPRRRRHSHRPAGADHR